MKHLNKKGGKNLNTRNISDNTKIKNFMLKHNKAFTNPIVNNFLKNKKNYNLFQKAIYDPSNKNKEEVDKAFKSYYEKVKKISYINNLIHYFSIDYDKHIKNYKNRYMLTLDNQINENNSRTFKEIHSNLIQQPVDNYYGNNLKEHIENTKLYKALNSLTQKQLMILEMKYLKEMTFKEIAKTTGTSPQNISNQHKKSLKKLLNVIQSIENN